MKLKKPESTKVRIKTFFNKRKQIVVEALEEGEKKSSFSFTVYDATIGEVKNLLIKTFEKYTGEYFSPNKKK